MWLIHLKHNTKRDKKAIGGVVLCGQTAVLSFCGTMTSDLPQSLEPIFV